MALKSQLIVIQLAWCVCCYFIFSRIMAKLLAYYTLCPVNDRRDFLGVSADAENGAIINTLGRNIVVITKVCRGYVYILIPLYFF